MHTPTAWFNRWAQAAQVTAFHRSKRQDEHQQPSIFSNEKERKKAVFANKPWPNETQLFPTTSFHPLQPTPRKKQHNRPFPSTLFPCGTGQGKLSKKATTCQPRRRKKRITGGFAAVKNEKMPFFFFVLQWEGRNESEIECRLQRGVEYRPARYWGE